MIGLSPINVLRWRSVQISRAYKELFRASETVLRRAGEIVLLDLREFCCARKTTFNKDPLIMARLEGRRDVFLRLAAYLNLDEETVQQLMEIDDGNG